VTVAGAELSGIYVGPAQTPEVIDPDLLIDVTAPDWDGTSVERVHYGELTPQARAAFLVWQRTGRRAPQAPSAWALLHLYGLERRILLEGDDGPELAGEAQALGEVYGSDPEVARVARALAGRHDRHGPPPLIEDAVPDEVQIELGRRALASQPIDAAWALAWAWFHPEIPRRDAAKRAPEEFARLWTIRFDERFPGGLEVRPRRRRLALDYRPANPSLPSPLELTVPDASDVFLTMGQGQVLAEITEQVEAELAPYVRWRTRYPDDAAVASIRAAAVLPDPLLGGSAAADAARPLVDLVEFVLDERDDAVTDCDPILRLWGEATGQASADRRDAVEIAQILERFGIGIEPDVRFGGRPITRRSPAVVFRQSGIPTTSPSDGYAAALVALELCAAVAAADGVVDDAERAMLVEQVNRVEGLTDSERVRLDAHRVLVASSDLRLDDVASRMVGLPLVERHSLASYLLDLARVDGVVTDDEVRVLRAVHELLDLNPDEVERRLRPRVVPLAPQRPPEPVAVLPEEAETESLERTLLTPDEPLAEPGERPERLVQVDEERLSATQANNEMVRSLLTAIFDGEDEDDAPAPVVPAAAGDTIAALDVAHSALLRDLAQRHHTRRRDLEIAAAEHGVLPDGALDVINEAALDRTEDLVVELHGDESVTVDPDVYEEMCA
jgi:uncharacterized tellurite resistance protein B-like protein